MLCISENQAFMILNSLPGLGPITVQRLLEHFRGDARRIFTATASQLREVPRLSNQIVDSIVNHERYFDLSREERRLASLRGNFFCLNHDKYPVLLKKIEDAPSGIYTIGEIDDLAPMVAIIGSRTTTLYGLGIARALAMELAKRGFCIVSGMARGIDSTAHEGALAAGGKTIAVFGNGVDVIYPRENAILYKKIVENGAVVSEFALGRRADKQTFPVRNRLIAGLCHAVIVVESSKLGGSMITARFAAEYGRHVFAIPGRIDQPSSSGCLALIRGGAMMLTCVDDFFEDVPYFDTLQKPTVSPLDGVQSPADWNVSKHQGQILELQCPVEKRIYEILLREKFASVDVIAIHAGLPIGKILHSLQMLEIRGLVGKRYDGLFRIADGVPERDGKRLAPISAPCACFA
jgi:DNA processing protein